MEFDSSQYDLNTRFIAVTMDGEFFAPLVLFSVTRRSRSDVSQSVSESLTLRTELTDVTLVSEDTY